MAYPNKYKKIVNDNIPTIEKMCNDSCTVMEIANELNVKYHSLRQYLISIGIRVPNKTCKKNSKYDEIFDINKDYIVNKLESGESLIAICKEMEIPYIYNSVKSRFPELLNRSKSDIIKNKMSESKKILSSNDEEKIISLYLSKNSMYTIQQKYYPNLCPVTIWNVLNKYNIKRNNQSEYWTDERRMEYKHKAMNGEIGIHAQDGKYRFTLPEQQFASWCELNSIEYERQYQIEPNTHRFDFILKGTNILIETDGVFWHSTKEQMEKDEMFMKFANEKGYVVYRFTDSEIDSSKLECFNILLDKIQVDNDICS